LRDARPQTRASSAKSDHEARSHTGDTERQEEHEIDVGQSPEDEPPLDAGSFLHLRLPPMSRGERKPHSTRLGFGVDCV